MPRTWIFHYTNKQNLKIGHIFLWRAWILVTNKAGSLVPGNHAKCVLAEDGSQSGGRVEAFLLRYNVKQRLLQPDSGTWKHQESKEKKKYMPRFRIYNYWQKGEQVTSIKWTSKGAESNYKWPQFRACYSTAVQNTVLYNRYKLRAVFLPCLNGTALDWPAFLQVCLQL